jgi:hypothetical protein
MAAAANARLETFCDGVFAIALTPSLSTSGSRDDGDRTSADLSAGARASPADHLPSS